MERIGKEWKGELILKGLDWIGSDWSGAEWRGPEWTGKERKGELKNETNRSKN